MDSSVQQPLQSIPSLKGSQSSRQLLQQQAKPGSQQRKPQSSQKQGGDQLSQDELDAIAMQAYWYFYVSTSKGKRAIIAY